MTGERLDESVVADVRTRLNAALHERSFAELAEATAGLADEFEPDRRDLVVAILGTLVDAASEQVEERVIIAGTSHLARHGRTFRSPSIRSSKRSKNRWFCCGCSARRRPPIALTRIGHENDLAAMETVRW